MSKYTNAAQQRVLKALMVLAGHELEGLAPAQVARALHTSQSNATRDLANLLESGLAERLDSNRWRLSPRLVQIAKAHTEALARYEANLEEVKQRYSRLPR
jgi:DNA-binding IclR family transcriptional regulator